MDQAVAQLGGAAEIIVSGVADFGALEAKWRDLEGRSNPSFFQSWTWAGCLAGERFTDPVLVEARDSGRTVALALFNRRGRTLYLGESGDPSLDQIYVEYNGVLAEVGREAELTVACLRAVRTRGVRLVLGGVNAATAASAAETGYVRCGRSLASPVADLSGQDRGFMDRRSANTRQQLRRSNRAYAAEGGNTIARAGTPVEAAEFMDELIALHQRSWVARGEAGAFAGTFFRRFHQTLIARGLERGEIDLFRIAGGTEVIGFLYNFRYRGHSLAYQSGFDYARSDRHRKPGMTSHYEAIRFAEGWKAVQYDFLAGDDRYKRSLSDRADTLYWIEVGSRWSPRFLALGLWDALVAGRRRLM